MVEIHNFAPETNNSFITFKMKKILFLVAASALMVACGQKGQTSDAANGSDSAVAASDSLVFEGELPGGDATFNTRLALAQDSTNGFSLSEQNTKDNATETHSGKFEAVESKDAKGFKLTVAQDDVRYFLQKNDSTHSLVGDSTLTPAASGMNYDLKLKK